MKTVVIACGATLWSIEPGKGAPSFFNTVKGYMDGGWETFLINTDTDEAVIQCGLHRVKHIQINGYNKKRPQNKIGKWFYNIRAQNEYNQQIAFALEKILKTQDTSNTILYAYEITAVPMMKRYSIRYGIPLVTRFQGTILGSKKLNLLSRFAYPYHFRALSTPADMVIMTNDGSQGERVLRELDNKSPRIFFWRNGVDPIIPREGDHLIPIIEELNDNVVLMTVSRLVKWKRVDRAIQALKDVVQHHPECKLVIAGDGDDRERLESIVEELSLQKHVLFLGRIPHALVYEVMKRADIFLSLYDISNVGNPLLEAMMCSKPIITLNNGDTYTLIKNRDTGIILDLNEINKIPASIIELIENKELARMIGKNAGDLAKVEFWSWEQRITEELHEVDKLLVH